jgi:hypothetical protein
VDIEKIADSAMTIFKGRWASENAYVTVLRPLVILADDPESPGFFSLEWRVLLTKFWNC